MMAKTLLLRRGANLFFFVVMTQHYEIELRLREEQRQQLEFEFLLLEAEMS